MDDKTLESTEMLLEEEQQLPLKVWTQHVPVSWQDTLRSKEDLDFAGSIDLETAKEQSKGEVDHDTINFKMVSATLTRAKEDEADLVLFSNEQQDKIGLAVRNHENGNFQLLTGHQLALLLVELLVERHLHATDKEETDKDLLFIRSVITSDVLDTLASYNRLRCVTSYSGYEALREAVAENEENYQVLAAVDEMNHIVLPGLSQKEGLQQSVELLLDKARSLKEESKSLLDFLIRLYTRYGFYQEKSFGVVKDSSNGRKQIDAVLRQFRNAKKIDFMDAPVRLINDFQKGVFTNLLTDKKGKTDLPKENMLQVVLDDNTKITLQPAEDYSKLYYHISVNTRILSREGIEEAKASASVQMMRLMNMMAKI